jgi:hypothetical protein
VDSLVAFKIQGKMKWFGFIRLKTGLLKTLDRKSSASTRGGNSLEVIEHC